MYHVENPGVTSEDYVRAVQIGNVCDWTLTPMLGVALTPKGVIRNYMEDGAHNAAVVLEWRA